jgi:hypothetical protein
MDLKLGDLVVEEHSESQVIGRRPHTTAGGNTAHVRVESVSSRASPRSARGVPPRGQGIMRLRRASVIGSW